MPHAIKSYFPGKLSYLIESIIKIKEELYVTVVTINAIYLKKVIKIELKLYLLLIKSYNEDKNPGFETYRKKYAYPYFYGQYDFLRYVYSIMILRAIAVTLNDGGVFRL